MLTLPISVFVGLISRHFMFLSKFFGLSLMVMKAGFSMVGLNLFSICSFFAIHLHSFTMLAAVWCFSFLYFCVISSLKSLS